MTRISPGLYPAKQWTDEAEGVQRTERKHWDDPIPARPGDSYSDRHTARQAFRRDFSSIMSGLFWIIVGAVAVPILCGAYALASIFGVQ